MDFEMQQKIDNAKKSFFSEEQLKELTAIEHRNFEAAYLLGYVECLKELKD